MKGAENNARKGAGIGREKNHANRGQLDERRQ
jgi:hypothetical protein